MVKGHEVTLLVVMSRWVNWDLSLA